MKDFDPKEKFSASSEVLQRLFEDGKSPLSGAFTRWKLWFSWKEVVGPTIGQLTEPVGMDRGMLWVWVKNSSWMQQLFFMRHEVLQTIQEKMGNKNVKAIRFTLDRREVPESAQARDEIREIISKIAPSERDKD